MNTHTPESNAEYEDNTTLEFSVYWLQAIEYQGKRVFRAKRESEECHYPFLATAILENHFFLVACIKAQRWLRKLSDIATAEKENIATFLVLTQNAKVVRDKREHDDEYFGTGKIHEQEPMHNVQTSSSVKLRVGTSVSVFVDGKYLIGGILDVQQTIDAARSLRTTLVKIQHAYWDNRKAEHFKMQEHFIGDEFANASSTNSPTS